MNNSLETYMSKNYNKVTNFSGTKIGDFFYIVENNKPQKIRCIEVLSKPSSKEYTFVKVDNNNNNNILDEFGNSLGQFDEKGKIKISDEKGKFKNIDDLTCDSNMFNSDESEIYSGIELFTIACNNASINDRLLNSAKKITTDLNGNDENIDSKTKIFFWKKKLTSAFTGYFGSKNSASNYGSNGGRKRTKRRGQTRRKTKRQRRSKMQRKTRHYK